MNRQQQANNQRLIYSVLAASFVIGSALLLNQHNMVFTGISASAAAVFTVLAFNK